jgi:hypothetical protein
MSQEYVIPPGTEHVWTPPDQVVIARTDDGVDTVTAIRMIKVQAVVRGQNQSKILELVEQLDTLWQSFLDSAVSKEQIANQLIDFRNQSLTNVDPVEVDNVTIQIFEDVITKALAESTRN